MAVLDAGPVIARKEETARMSTDYEGKTVFVSGGTSGINLGIAEAFAGAGAAVFVISRNPEKVESAVAGLNRMGSADGCPADVRDMDAVRAAVARCHDHLRPGHDRRRARSLRAGRLSRRRHGPSGPALLLEGRGDDRYSLADGGRQRPRPSRRPGGRGPCLAGSSTGTSACCTAPAVATPS
jgi:hypothetical protein